MQHKTQGEGSEYESKVYVALSLHEKWMWKEVSELMERRGGLSTPMDYYIIYKAMAYLLWIRDIIDKERAMFQLRSPQKERELTKEAKDRVDGNFKEFGEAHLKCIHEEE